MQNTFRINVDLKKETYMEEPVVTQNDAITFLISVFDAGNPFSLSEVTTATLAHTRLDGVTVVTEGTKIDDNTIQFILGTEETKVPGRVSATVQLYDTDERVSTIRFTYTVLKDPTGEGYIPTERDKTLIEIVIGDGPLIIQQAQDAANFANEQGQFAQAQANAASEAATRANEAAQSATNAANEANTAAQSANTAAQSANDASQTANEAAQNANQAATSANEAADNAMTQAQYAQQQGDYAKAQGDAANLAANNANNAANNANNAATNADNAAATAINAADNANTAADNANNATTNANNAAENANTKAANAQTQADYAKAQGDYAKGQGDYAKAQGDYAKAQGDYAKSVADANKTRWLNPVATFADIATMYPTPQHGDTVQTLDDGKIYRYSSGQWVFKEQYTETVIGALVTEMNKQNRQTAVLTHGTQIVNASQNSPLDIRIEGRTLVNLLGIQGRTATSATVTLDSAKYYVLVNEDGTNVTVDGVSQTVPYKFTGKSSVSLSWTSGKVALYEVNAAEYNNILTTWTAGEVNRRYPYVDSVQHVQNPYVIAEGDNLAGVGADWTIGATTSTYDVPIVAGQTYTLSKQGTSTTTMAFLDANKNTISSGLTGTQTAPANAKYIRITTNKITPQDIDAEKIMLTLGSQPKPFVPRNPSMLFAEVKLGAIGDKKDILWKDGQDWKVTKWIEKDYILDGKLAWAYFGDAIGFKIARIPISNALDSHKVINPSYSVFTKYDGVNLGKYTASTERQKDMGIVISGYAYVTIADTDSGWDEHYKPSAQEIQAYFNGWKANGYTTGTPVTNELTGQLAPSGTYTFANAGAYRNVVVEKSTDGATWSPATENTDFSININGTKAVLTNLSASSLYFRISYNYGVTVNSWASLVDGSAPATNTLAYVSTNLAPNFTPYKLSYVLATPQTIAVTDKVEGDLVVNGATQVEVGSGFTYTEVDGKRTYTKLAENQRYNVTSNILSIIANYDNSLKSVVDSVVAKQSDLASNQQALIRSVAELYKRVKALGG